MIEARNKKARIEKKESISKNYISKNRKERII